MNYAKIFTCDISDGPGVRLGLYTQGCNHHCENCFNKETWDPDGGKEWTEETNKIIISMLKKDRYSGISILGGEPLFWCDVNKIISPENNMLYALLIDIHREFGNKKSVWMWTGYKWEDLVCARNTTETSVNYFQINASLVLWYVDVIIDGKFEKDNCNGRHLYRGSNNQRVIDVKKTLYSQTCNRNNDVVLYCE